MLKHPRLKYCYFVELVGDDKVLLLSEKHNTFLQGKLYYEVLSILREDGVSMEDLIVRLEGKFSMLEVMAAITMLEKDGYLTETTSALPPEASAYWNSIDIHAETFLNVFKEKPVSIEFLGECPQEVFLQTFHDIGIRTIPARNGSLRVIITDEYEREELQQINQDFLDVNQPWMLVKPVGIEVWIGPIFLPGQTGCWECLRQRLQNNHPLKTFLRHHHQTAELLVLPAAHVPLTQYIAANLTALEVTKWLYFGRNDRLEGKLLTFDTATLITQTHTLVKRPQCPTCGEVEYQRSKPPVSIILQKTSEYCATTQGGYREVPLENTLEQYKHHVSPLTGVIQALKPYYPDNNAPVYNYSSGINLALQSKNLFWLNYHIRGANGGKGRSWLQAKAGALCEAIERYSCTYQGNEYYITDSLQSLGSDAIHPNDCMNFSEKQYQHREEINQYCSKFYLLVPQPFDESLDMHWTPVYSLTHHRFKYLPSCFCYAQYPAGDEYQLFAYPDSNGCAAGNSIEEAILQGFLELVERDSVALWWYNMLRKPAVDVLSFHDPYFAQLLQYYASLQRRFYVLDLTADLNIPAFGAIAHRTDDPKSEPIFGFGAHVDAKIALERALLEVNQLLPIVNIPEAERAKGRYRTKDAGFLDWLNTATLADHPYLTPDDTLPVKTVSDYPRLCEPNIYDSLAFCIDTVAKQELETLVLDMTRPDIGLPVVKVIVPGLRHFWKRLAPGRLYDVPIKMEWLNVPIEEEYLNPIGLFT